MGLQDRASLGSRGRIGVIQPAACLAIEHEWPKYLPDHVMFPVARVRLDGGSLDDYKAMEQRCAEASRNLASAGSGLLLYACAVGSVVLGPDGEQGLTGRLASLCGRPVLGLGQACVRAFESMKARSLLLLTPYADDLNAAFRLYAASVGLEVTATARFPTDTILEASTLKAADVCGCAMDALEAHQDVEALWMPCSAVPTLAALDDIEERSGKPAVSGSQAMLWAGLRGLGVQDPITRAGKLLLT